MLTSKKTKKSKHGKKNWRKNIDVSDIEKSQQKLNQEIIKNQKIQNKIKIELKKIEEQKVIDTNNKTNKPLIIEPIIKKENNIKNLNF